MISKQFSKSNETNTILNNFETIATAYNIITTVTKQIRQTMGTYIPRVEVSNVLLNIVGNLKYLKIRLP